jgi:hypothetical protein
MSALFKIKKACSSVFYLIFTAGLGFSLLFSMNISFSLAADSPTASQAAPVVTVPTSGSNSSAAPAGTPASGSSAPAAAPSSGLTGIPAAGGTYTLLARIDAFWPNGTVDVKGGGLSGYLQGLYRAGIAIATGLALIMIVVGGLEYVSTDSIQGKSSGKDRIQNAILGLLLALTSYIILQQVNPNLLKSNLQVADTQSVGGITGSAVKLASEDVVAAPALSNYPYAQGLVNNALYAGGVSGGPQGGGSTVGSGVLSNSGMAARIVASARANINQSTCLVVTENGRKGCGFAFGVIMNGAGITFSNLTSTTVLSTSNIYSVLSSDTRFVLVSINNVSKSAPGDIIISPTVGDNTGHVGIIETNQAGSIISNSSASASIQANFNGSRWLNYYGGKGLTTYIFRYR